MLSNQRVKYTEICKNIKYSYSFSVLLQADDTQVLDMARQIPRFAMYIVSKYQYDHSKMCIDVLCACNKPMPI
jgi:hypothetical protein